MKNRKSQCSEILAYLMGGNTLTAVEAFNKFDCMRLAARVKDLRDMGYPIYTRIGSRINRKKQEVTFAVYSLKERAILP